jgi:hypothetical protein
MLLPMRSSCELSPRSSEEGTTRPFPAFFPAAQQALVDAKAADAPLGRREKLLREAARRIEAVLRELHDQHGIRADEVAIDLRYAAYGRTEILC